MRPGPRAGPGRGPSLPPRQAVELPFPVPNFLLPCVSSSSKNAFPTRYGQHPPRRAHVGGPAHRQRLRIAGARAAGGTTVYVLRFVLSGTLDKLPAPAAHHWPHGRNPARDYSPLRPNYAPEEDPTHAHHHPDPARLDMPHHQRHLHPPAARSRRGHLRH